MSEHQETIEACARGVTKGLERAITITTTGGNVSDLKSDQHRWECSCGEQGPWVGAEWAAVGGGQRHGTLDFFGKHSVLVRSISGYANDGAEVLVATMEATP